MLLNRFGQNDEDDRWRRDLGGHVPDVGVSYEFSGDGRYSRKTEGGWSSTGLDAPVGQKEVDKCHVGPKARLLVRDFRLLAIIVDYCSFWGPGDLSFYDAQYIVCPLRVAARTG